MKDMISNFQKKKTTTLRVINNSGVVINRQYHSEKCPNEMISCGAAKNKTGMSIHNLHQHTHTQINAGLAVMFLMVLLKLWSNGLIYKLQTQTENCSIQRPSLCRITFTLCIGSV